MVYVNLAKRHKNAFASSLTHNGVGAQDHRAPMGDRRGDRGGDRGRRRSRRRSGSRGRPAAAAAAAAASAAIGAADDLSDVYSCSCRSCTAFAIAVCWRMLGRARRRLCKLRDLSSVHTRCASKNCDRQRQQAASPLSSKRKRSAAVGTSAASCKVVSETRSRCLHPTPTERRARGPRRGAYNLKPRCTRWHNGR